MATRRGGNNPTLCVAAYWHLHVIFTAVDATNVVWAWCPNVTDTDGSNRTTMDYYPGDSYVDWIGVARLQLGSAVWQAIIAKNGRDPRISKEFRAEILCG